MTDSEPNRLTRLLKAISQGDRKAPHELLDLVYGELIRIARKRLASERKDRTLQATDLVHEAWLKLIGGTEERAPPVAWENRTQFYRAAAEAMRRILIDHARKRGRIRRGGGRKRILIDVADLAREEDPERVEEVDEAIERLCRWDARLGEMVRLRFFAGLSIEETAAALSVSPRTVRRDWTFARAWLYRVLHEEE
jgi:RNA polymerase sigma factor (TIGR02999 family)